MGRYEATDEEVEEVWNTFWKDLIAPNGVIDAQAVKNELRDYYVFLDEAAKVYFEVTGGRISKQNTTADAVIGQYQEELERDIQRAIKDEYEEMIGWIEGYAYDRKYHELAERTNPIAAVVTLLRERYLKD